MRGRRQGQGCRSRLSVPAGNEWKTLKVLLINPRPDAIALNELVSLLTQNLRDLPVLQKQFRGLPKSLIVAVPEAAITAAALAAKHCTIAVAEYGTLQQPRFQYRDAEAFIRRGRHHESARLNRMKFRGLTDKPGRDQLGMVRDRHHRLPRSEERRVGKECRSRWS